MRDSQYQDLPYKLNERPHDYGNHVHLLSDPYLITKLARLCHPDCVQPEVNRLFQYLYRSMGRELANHYFTRTNTTSPTRMLQSHPEANYEGQLIDPSTRVVIVSMARAGIIPSLELFDLYSDLLDPKFVRVDHVMINRATDENHQITGATIHGSKIGGDVDGATVIIPDPMGATGSSLNTIISQYKNVVKGTPKRWISVNLIVTPEFVKKVHDTHPSAEVFAIRLDRAFSSKDALSKKPGELPDQEKGLNENGYIVPGGGGFGELSSNAWV